MKCYNHPDVDAVGTCSQCGRAGCRECIEDVGGVLICTNCIAQEIYLESAHAKRCIRNSWIVGVVGGLLLGIFVGHMSNSVGAGFLFGLVYFYFFWSTYWGFKWIWPKWTQMLHRGGCVLFLPLWYWLGVLLVLWEIAGTYGMLGGALYQYFKYRRIARAAADMQVQTAPEISASRPRVMAEEEATVVPRKTRVRWVLPLVIVIVAGIGISVIVSRMRESKSGKAGPRRTASADVVPKDPSKYGQTEKVRVFVYPSNKIEARASSQLKDFQTEKYGLSYYAADNTLDGKLTTAWSEGIKDNGIGEFIRYQFTEEIALKGIKIVGGYSKSKMIFYANNRLKKIRLSFDRARFVELPLEDISEWQRIDLEDVYPTKSVTLTILEVYPGTKYKDTAFSDVQFLYQQ